MRGATGVVLYDKKYVLLFQSTRPVRGATVTTVFRARVAEFQSTRPVRGATPMDFK